MTSSTIRTAAVLLACVAFAPAGSAQDEPTKRKEGRYFVELAEIMLSTEQFDVSVATIDPGGVRAGAPPHERIASLSGWSAEAPMVTIGINRPSGKTTFSASMYDFEIKDAFIPKDFRNESDVVSSHMIPPGILYQRQAITIGTFNDDNYVPNIATLQAHFRKVDYKSAEITVEHNILENERFRMRWLAGLRYAQLEQGLAYVTAFSREFSEAVFDQGVIQEAQDFFFLESYSETHGLGPKLGMDGRILLGEKKKWSLTGRFDVAAIAEHTSASYGIRLVDASGEVVAIVIPPDFRLQFDINEAPLIPGLGEPIFRPVYAAVTAQNDFTEMTWHATGRVGFRYKPKDFFSVGLDVYQMRWTNVLSQMGIIDTVHESARFEQVPPRGGAVDPQLTNVESRLIVPRFTRRENYVFDGVSLVLSFEF